MEHIYLPIKPVTKKNHQQIITNHATGRPMIIQSKDYREYEKTASVLLRWNKPPIEGPCNVKMVFYMPTRRRVDLVNLQEACLDILVRCGVLADDNSNVVASMDGSRVEYRKDNPGTEIWITEVEDGREG